ncbi:hypothetical protein C8R46DRAFT_41011 [Mycena filopes]|nr:hypothetical protein C8R46DRAFT_41011 [Mycena filopes]
MQKNTVQGVIDAKSAEAYVLQDSANFMVAVNQGGGPSGTRSRLSTSTLDASDTVESLLNESLEALTVTDNATEPLRSPPDSELTLKRKREDGLCRMTNVVETAVFDGTIDSLPPSKRRKFTAAPRNGPSVGPGNHETSSFVHPSGGTYSGERPQTGLKIRINREVFARTLRKLSPVSGYNLRSKGRQPSDRPGANRSGGQSVINPQRFVEGAKKPTPPKKRRESRGHFEQNSGKRYACPHGNGCKGTFHRRWDADRHAQSHGDNKQHECGGDCTARFGRKDALLRHQRNSHHVTTLIERKNRLS